MGEKLRSVDEKIIDVGNQLFNLNFDYTEEEFKTILYFLRERKKSLKKYPYDGNFSAADERCSLSGHDWGKIMFGGVYLFELAKQHRLNTGLALKCLNYHKKVLERMTEEVLTPSGLDKASSYINLAALYETTGFDGRWKEIIELRKIIHAGAFTGVLGDEAKEHTDPWALINPKHLK